MSFWNAAGANPKRKFRFRIEIGFPVAAWGGDQQIWYAKTCTAPSVEVSSVEHMFSDHVFNFPGRAKWGDVEMTLVDPGGDAGATSVGNDTVDNFNKLLEAFGYKTPPDGTGATMASYQTIGRNRVTGGRVNIIALDDDGKYLETWTLKNAFPISFKYGDFDYGSDELREFSISWKYDYATCETVAAGAGNAYFD